ncbi:MAG: DUF58 domain-containing protein [Planctomycetota bacterium]
MATAEALAFDAMLPVFLDLPALPPSVDLDERGRLHLRAEWGDFKGHVPYVPGDDLRFLDWSVLARSGQRVSRRFELIQHRRLRLLVDASPSMRLREAGLRDLLCLYGFLALHRLDSVELRWGDEPEPRRFEDSGDWDRLRDLLRTLPLEGGCPEPVPDADRSTGSLLVSDFQPEDEWRARLARHREEGQGLLCLFPRLGFEGHTDRPLPTGRRDLRDLETGKRLQVELGSRLHALFVEEQRDFEHDMEACCRDLGHGFLAIDLPDDEHRLDFEAWLPFLTRRRLRR